MEKFYSKEVLVGIKVSSFTDGTNAATTNEGALQVLTLKHPAGTEVKLHGHKPIERTTHMLEECLIVKKGKIKIELYDHTRNHVADVILESGELFILINGIWAVHFLEDSEVIETKNGPYRDDKISMVK